MQNFIRKFQLVPVGKYESAKSSGTLSVTYISNRTFVEESRNRVKVLPKNGSSLVEKSRNHEGKYSKFTQLNTSEMAINQIQSNQTKIIKKIFFFDQYYPVDTHIYCKRLFIFLCFQFPIEEILRK